MSLDTYILLLLFERYNRFYKNVSSKCGIKLSNCFWLNLLLNCCPTARLKIISVLSRLIQSGVLFPLENPWLLDQYSKKKNQLHGGYEIILGYYTVSQYSIVSLLKQMYVQLNEKIHKYPKLLINNNK